MALDGITLTTIVDELRPRLIDARIDRIVQPLADEVHLLGRHLGKNWRLLLSANPAQARLHFTQENKPNPTQPPMFCMVLRKHLENGRIRRIIQPAWERIVAFEIESTDELGGKALKTLILEIMGKHSNLILVDSDNMILDGLRRYSHAVSRHREVLPGRPYVAPPASTKKPLAPLDDQSLGELIYSTAENVLIVDGLQRNLAGIAPETARELVHRAGLAPTARVGECGHYELQRLALTLGELVQIVQDGKTTPLIFWQGSQPKTFAPWPLEHLSSLRQEPAPTMNDGLASFYDQKYRADRLAAQRQTLAKRISLEWERANRKRAGQEADIAAAEKDRIGRTWGELLLANLYRVQPGDVSVDAEDFYDPAVTHRIPLDPSLTAAENAQRFFARYNKATATITQAGAQLAATVQELHYLDSVLVALEQADDAAALEEIRQELVQSGYLPPQSPSRPQKKRGTPGSSKDKKPKEAPPQPTVWTTAEGGLIWIGKNNRQNDYLTMKMARDGDIWLHAKDMPGSHVVVPLRDKGGITPELLELAANCAAYFSRGRDAAKVPVDYTERRYVRKPGGAKPGYVIYDHQQTIWASPQAVPEALRGS
ncbi:Rqc2 family fibronectin-binding protein [Heliophilum fasciatum]|uniref:Rqc2 homolog RqcH n=1 Tax=Heliophilum fasciatum TaxID=35700 RepID=A0A4V2SY07_9FIRM|nr:NFACT RNA binding domain-containing protein [Heliophilum fasciatum]MCW2277219.1 putative ribosome quality control (RQC) complex YloA/Tae2 family protein [Heliophilum fasciatum]TCP68146.1 putative ribosome quality control (RQC) complex YloA/Tae2 family protein [Heliophilum fasciatum]